MTDAATTPDPLADLRNRHLAFYLDAARRGYAGLEADEDQTPWIDLLASEQENFRSALRWCIDSGQAEAGLELAAVLGEFWMIEESFSEARQWLDHLLSMNGSSGLPRAKACLAMAEVLWSVGEYEESVRRADEAARLAADAGDSELAAKATTRAGWSLWYAGKVAEAGPRFEEAAEALRGAAHPYWLETALRGLGWYQLSLGNRDGAIAFHEEGLRVLRAVGNRRWVVEHLGAHATLYSNLGDVGATRRLREEAVDIVRELGDKRELMFSLAALISEMIGAPGELERAETLAAEYLRVARETADAAQSSEALRFLGSIAWLKGELDLARTLYREALDQSHRVREVTTFTKIDRRRILNDLAALELVEGKRDEARRLLDESRALQLLISAGPFTGWLLLQHARMTEDIDRVRGTALLEDAVRTLEGFEDTRWQFVTLSARIDLLRARGDLAEAVALARVNLDEVARGGHPLAAEASAALAGLLYESGELDEARTVLETAVEAAANVFAFAVLRSLLVSVVADQGDVEAADGVLRDLGVGWRALRRPQMLARLLEAAGKVAAGRERWTAAARLLGAAEGYRQLTATQRKTNELTSFAHAVDAARAALGEKEFATSFEAGTRQSYFDALREQLG